MESQELIATRASPSPSPSSSPSSSPAQSAFPAVAPGASVFSLVSESGEAGGEISFTPLFSPCSLSASTSNSTPARSCSPSSSAGSSSASSSSSSPLHLPATPRALAATCGSFSCLPPPSFHALLASLRAFLHTEASFPPPIDYTAAVQLECSLQDRDTIVQYLQASAAHWQLHSDTWQLAVCLFDRFMARRSVKRPYLQLAALASLLLACKMAESHTPSLQQLSHDTNGLYSAAMIREMELLILSELQYRLSDTSAGTALSHVLQAFGHALPPHIRHTAQHILCCSAAASAFIACTASLLAIAALFAAFRWHGQAQHGVSFIVEQYQHHVCGSAQGNGEVVAMGAVVLVSQEMMQLVKRQGDAQMLHDDSDDEQERDDQDSQQDDHDHHDDQQQQQQQQQQHAADEHKEADGQGPEPPTPGMPGTPVDELNMDILTPPPAQPATAAGGDASESVREDLEDTDTEDANSSSSSRLKRRRLVYYH